RVLPVSLAVDARRPGVGLTDDLLRAALGLRADLAQVALHGAQDLLASAFALRAEARRDTLPLRDHAALDLLAHGIDVVDALDAHVDELDAERGHLPLGGREDVALELAAAALRAREIGLLERGDVLVRELRDVDLPIGRAHDLLELRARDDVTR